MNVKRLVIGAAAVILAIVVGAVAYGGGAGRDCVWRSVDERAYVRANEAVLRSVPLTPRLRRGYSTTWTHGISAPNSCLPHENGPPYSAFITTRVFVRRQGEPPIGFDRTTLGPEWVLDGAGLGGDWTYRQGDARLTITNHDEGALLSVDHRAYAP